MGFVTGTVTDRDGNAVDLVNIGVIGEPYGTTSNQEGYFFLEIPAERWVTLVYTFIGYESVNYPIKVGAGDTVELSVSMRQSAIHITEFTVEGTRRDKPSTFVLDPAEVELLPNPSGNISSLLKTMMLGASAAGGELSSQYSVRGGNFDENLIYVNDFQVYRPQLIRSGQQEGLSFVNQDLVRNLLFSSGGFEARYGDKMASVLDVQYKVPSKFNASIEASLLGVNAHVEGANKSQRFTYLAGLRQKSNKYLLNSLNVEGSYQPSFTDFQSLLTYKLNERWVLEFINNYARNRYTFIPESRITSIGTVQDVKELEVFFEGQEVDEFETFMGGLAATYASDSGRFRLKFLTSAYHSLESETFDIIGDYFLYQVENNLGEENFGERLFGLGYGTYHDYARNYLDVTVANAAHKGFWFINDHVLEWGLTYQHEVINDELKEWNRTDSAFYSLPYNSEEVRIKEYLRTEINLESNRYSGYVQDTWIISDDSVRDMNLTGGLRFHYWDLNNELLVSPRAQFSFKPAWKRDVILKTAAGLYQQAPFYRELRNFEGELNLGLRAQKSAHFVVGGDYVFDVWGREFRLLTEAYYKHMWDLVPYEIEDVKIRYFGENMARGYAAGIDLRINGEFVNGAESWINLSVMQTKEDIEGDFYIDTAGVKQEIGYLNRPTDQRVNVGILFQDYLPMNENFKMHLNLLFGTGLPFGPPNSPRFRNALRIPPYRRVDIGFSALLYDENQHDVAPVTALKPFRSLWASLEVFNLLGIENTISHIWIKDNNNLLYAFENHLTSRRINLRVIIKI